MSILYVTYLKVSFLVSYTLLLIIMPLFAHDNWQQTMHIGFKALWNRKGSLPMFYLLLQTLFQWIASNTFQVPFPTIAAYFFSIRKNVSVLPFPIDACWSGLHAIAESSVYQLQFTPLSSCAFMNVYLPTYLLNRNIYSDVIRNCYRSQLFY